MVSKLTLDNQITSFSNSEYTIYVRYKLHIRFEKDMDQETIDKNLDDWMEYAISRLVWDNKQFKYNRHNPPLIFHDYRYDRQMPNGSYAFRKYTLTVIDYPKTIEEPIPNQSLIES
jgi:hypothetical protein